MATYERFEELEVWQLGIELSLEIYAHTNSDLFSRDFGLKDQVRRCSVSIPSNIAEGYERDSPRSFIYFLNVAKASCGELRTQLKIAQGLNYISETEYDLLNNKCLSVSKQLKGFIKYLNSRGKK
jgi:four helix bundle protein